MMPKIAVSGEGALLVEFGETIDPAINARVLALDAAIARDGLPGLRETVPTYRSLLALFDPDGVDAADLQRRIAHLVAETAGDEAAGRRSFTIPVTYGGAFGVDLCAVAQAHGLTEAAVVERHAAARYRVFMLGFMPGFAYLGGLPQSLATPRRAVPRQETPAGSVSIGGVQSAVSSIAAPSGWHLLGRTPARTFDPTWANPFLFEPGDRVLFEPISADAFASLAGRAERGEWRPQPDQTV